MKVTKIKKEVKAETLDQPKGTHWTIKFLMWIFDALATVILLALAVVGMKSILKAGVDPRIVYGVSALFVGLLASRLLERVFSVKR